MKLEKKLEKILQATGPIKPGDVVHVSVAHDEGCPALKTQNLADCTCNPDIEKMNPN